MEERIWLENRNKDHMRKIIRIEDSDQNSFFFCSIRKNDLLFDEYLYSYRYEEAHILRNKVEADKIAHYWRGQKWKVTLEEGLGHD